MNTVRRIAKNTLVLFIAQVISMILGFFYTMYTARYLGAEGFGVLSFALAFTGIFGVFGDMGLSTLTTREVARDKSLAGKYLGNIAAMKLVLVVITFCLIAIAINLLGYPEKTILVVYLIALSIIFSAFTRMFNSVFQAFEQMEYQSIGGILSSVLMLAGALIAISQGFGVVGFAAIYFMVSTITMGYSFVVCIWKFVFPKIEVDIKFWKDNFKAGLSFGFTGIFVTIYYWIDSVMLSLMKGDEVVGWYNASYRLMMVVLFIPSILNSVIFPKMSQFFVVSKDSLRIAYERYFRYMIIIAIPLGIGTTLLSDKIILFIYGAEYTNSIVALQILIWSSVVIFIGGAFARLLESSNRQIVITRITAICMLENVILNLMMIPKFSYIGASVATVITEFTALILGMIVCYKIGYCLSKNIILISTKAIVASLMMGLFIVSFNDLNLLFLILLSGIFYFIILYLLRVFGKDDMRLFRNIVNKKVTD